MLNLWPGLENTPGLAHVPAGWRLRVGEAYEVIRPAFLRPTQRASGVYPCPRECGCMHEVVRQEDGSLVAVCQCDPWNCDDLPLAGEDIVVWELNWGRLGRAVARAFGCDPREVDFGLPGTRQVASFSGAALPVLLTVQPDPESFRRIVLELVARLRERFILLAPTSRFLDVHAKELLANAHAGFFDLESHLTLLPNGTLQARRTAGELFTPFLPAERIEASDDEARRVFALLKALESEGSHRKAPAIQVFRLYCQEGLSRAKVAQQCDCAESLVTLRLQQIERKLGRKPAQLRQLATRFGRVEDIPADPRARRIYR